MARVVAQRDGATIFGPNSALGAEDEELLAAQFSRVPSHARILSHAEEVPAGGLAQHRLGQREFSGRTRPAGPQAGQIWGKRAKEFSSGHDLHNSTSIGSAGQVQTTPRNHFGADPSNPSPSLALGWALQIAKSLYSGFTASIGGLSMPAATVALVPCSTKMKAPVSRLVP